jgi:NAD(P)-dependent dehydrogenase (short-subunit alcohol dehydrogenase family)
MNIDPLFRPDLFAGKRILVTGGGTGLGREIAAKLLALGAQVWICGRREAVLTQAADALTAKHGGVVKTWVVDLRNAEAVEAMSEAIWADGPLTGLVNNAAGNFISPTQAVSSRGFDAIANTAMHGTFYVTNAVGKRWIRDKLPGAVVSVLTTWIWTGAPFNVPLTMAKAGLDGMTKSLAVEWGRHNIRVNAIAPGAFPTDGALARVGTPESSSDTKAANPMGRFGRAHELQNLTAFLLADGCEWLTGQTIGIDGAGHLANGSQSSALFALSDADWIAKKEQVRARDADEKTARSAPAPRRD